MVTYQLFFNSHISILSGRNPELVRSETRHSSSGFIIFEHVSKVYKTRTEEIEALFNITLEIEKQEFVTIVGPSGCGKSTLLKILAGLLPKTSGEIFLDGTPVTKPRVDIAVVFQDPVLLPWRNVLDNVLVPVEVFGWDKAKYRSRAFDLLEMVDLRGFENKYVNELSGGMKQRTAIARALIYDPSLLLMDEPFGALDAMTRENMNLELLRIWGESRKTIFFVTHSIPEAVFLANRVIVLSPRPGRITKIVNVDLPYPRSLEIMGTDRFGVYVKQIRSEFETKGVID